jgi:hypothetical protein
MAETDVILTPDHLARVFISVEVGTCAASE